MRTAAAIAALLMSLPLLAQDGIKDGKWEFKTTTKMPGMEMPELPPGVQLPPGIELGAGGPTVTYATCVSKDKMVPQDKENADNCKMEDIKQSGNTVSWKATCKTEDGQMTGKGTATYSGDTMKSEMTLDGTSDGEKVHMTQTTVGRYVGACDKKG